MDYGKLAATFADLATGKAVRVAPRKEVPHAGPEQAPLVFWSDWTDEALFTWAPVTLDIPLGDLPGPPSSSVECARCGEEVKDGREVSRNGEALCRACAGDAYYRE
jgi:formylmethanofuran dehydrogenase subunit E